MQEQGRAQVAQRIQQALEISMVGYEKWDMTLAVAAYRAGAGLAPCNVVGRSGDAADGDVLRETTAQPSGLCSTQA